MTTAAERTTAPLRRHQRGLSIVEFMVGIAVGLFVVGGAVKLFVDYVVGSRQMLLETRVNQDLRAAADLVVRDLRRASYWRNSASGLFGSSAGTPNPYRSVTAVVANSEITYSYDKDGVDSIDANEQFGFRLSNGALQLRNGAGGWQQITDPTTVRITAFTVGAPVERDVDLWTSCPCLWKMTCTPGSFKDPDPDTGSTGVNHADRPQLVVRQYAFTLRGRSTTDARVEREIRETVRVRNDETKGACPT